ncbi:hypothetical protein [Nonomuraea sp. NPDC050310]|uniref:hypothetical protein n=1 Tax=Nonomuraea sp. NPDC050310 TaxID=3154935 RepID=UPI0033C71892
MNQPPLPHHPPPKRKPGLFALVIAATCLALVVAGVGGYLVLRAVTQPGPDRLIAVVQDPAIPTSVSEEIVRTVVAMPQVDVVYEASPEELPRWFPDHPPWGDLNPGAFLVKLKPDADRSAVQAKLRAMPGVHMVVDVPDTGKTIGASGPG